MATRTMTAPARPETMSVPEAAAALGVAVAALEGIKRKPGATGQEFSAAQGAVELAEAALQRAQAWEAGAAQREREAKLAILEQRVRALYGRQPKVEASYKRLQAAYDDHYRAVSEDNAEIDAIIGELRLLGVGNNWDSPAEWGQQRYGGGVRVGDSSMCRQALPTIGLPWLPYTNPGRYIPPAPAPAAVGCLHAHTTILEGAEAAMNGIAGCRFCMDCRQVLNGPDRTTRPGWGSVVLGPLGLGR